MTSTRIMLICLLGSMPWVLAAAPVVGPRPAAEVLALACAGCHGTDGHSVGSTPSIAGKPVGSFIRLMSDFKSGKRRSSIMNRIAAGYQQADFAALAQHFAER